MIPEITWNLIEHFEQIPWKIRDSRECYGKECTFVL